MTQRLLLLTTLVASVVYATLAAAFVALALVGAA